MNTSNKNKRTSVQQGAFTQRFAQRRAESQRRRNIAWIAVSLIGIVVCLFNGLIAPLCMFAVIVVAKLYFVFRTPSDAPSTEAEKELLKEEQEEAEYLRKIEEEDAEMDKGNKKF